MKKLLCVLLMAALLASCAMAESMGVNAISISNLAVSATIEGEPTDLDLSGYEIVAAVNETGLELAVNGNGTALFSAGAQIVDGSKLAVQVDGMTSAYSVELEQLAQMAQAQAGVGVDQEALMNAIMNLDVAALSAALDKLPEKIEMEPIAKEDGSEAMSFRVPYDAINDLLAEVLPIVEQSGLLDVLGSDVNVEEIIGNLTGSNSGIEIAGEIAMGESMAFDVSLYLVEAGQRSEEGALRVTGDYAGNAGSLVVAVPDETAISVAFTAGETTNIVLGFIADGSDVKISFDATLFEVGGENFRTIDGASAIDLFSMGEEEMQAASQELEAAVEPLLMGIMSALYGQIG